MAVQINGSIVHPNGYEFAVVLDTGIIWPCDDYAAAKRLFDESGKQIKMRAHYVTDWMDAK